MWCTNSSQSEEAGFCLSDPAGVLSFLVFFFYTWNLFWSVCVGLLIYDCLRRFRIAQKSHQIMVQNGFETAPKVERNPGGSSAYQG